MARRASRRKLDWVYNEQAYTGIESTVAPGPANAIGVPLTVSQSSRRVATWGIDTAVPSITDYQSWAAIAEGGQQRIHGADCHVMVRPSAWAAGNVVRIGFRLLLARMDPVDGSMLLDPLYKFWATGLGDTTTPAQYANAGFMRETILYEVFGDNAQGWQVRLRWRSRKGLRIMDDFAAYLYIEAMQYPSASTSGIIIPRCRALVSEDA